jgi:hypothetical protein
MRSVLLIISLGVTAWVVAGVIALLVGAESKILWTCLFGTILGLIGLRSSIRRASKGKL